MEQIKSEVQGSLSIQNLKSKMVKVSYTPRYYADIGEGHVFPIRKFELVRDRLLREGTLTPADIVEPQPASIADVLLIHTDDYITRLRAGTLDSRELRRLGLPWSKALVRRSFLAAGGTLNAARWSLGGGIGSNLAGGTHHAFPDRGEGFCVLNDVAIAIRVLCREGLISRAAVVDCDVHQGNGTATIFAEDPLVFTFSMHGAKNYPLFKARSSLDLELPDATTDDVYLETLHAHLPRVFAHAPDIVFYLGGADPFAGDRLGRLSLSIAGLRARDEYVLGECRARRVPVVTVMSGGYAEDINDTVEIHCNTIRAARAVFDTADGRKPVA
ncbi:MAG TPA: histone deacetylase [Pyrinomonadaceae bacterium]|nr:histone deacetylase [Pyrinomonadaceae bacterium]